MIFRSKLVNAQWDTWCYWHDGKYYLYYLITENSGGEGFGVATSTDGLQWQDHGWAIKASEKMVTFLGTGSVWPDPKNEGRFLCNYSEWRLDEFGKQRQCILFAWSDDLVVWNKFGDDCIFRIDERYYERYGRWDCIFPIERDQGGYWGTWTATPKGSDNLNGGIGLGVSDDGISWEAIEPADVFPAVDEAGAIIEVDGKFHAMFGNFTNEEKRGMHAYVAEAFQGPYRIAEKSGHLLKMADGYFSRFFHSPDGVLVNHHVMDGRRNNSDRPITYVAPFKKFAVDSEGIGRWMWWPGNERLKGKEILNSQSGDFQQGIVVEGTLESVGGKEYSQLRFEVDELKFAIGVSGNGNVKVLIYDTKTNSWKILQDTDKDLKFSAQVKFRLLGRLGMIEFYCDDFFVTCCKLDCPDGKKFRCCLDNESEVKSDGNLRICQMNLQ